MTAISALGNHVISSMEASMGGKLMRVTGSGADEVGSAASDGSVVVVGAEDDVARLSKRTMKPLESDMGDIDGNADKLVNEDCGVVRAEGDEATRRMTAGAFRWN